MEIDINILVVFYLHLNRYDLKDSILSQGATMIEVGYYHNHPLENSTTTTTLLH